MPPKIAPRLKPPPRYELQRPETPLRFVSLFAGIGGIDLGLERTGMECVGQVEIEPYCQRVLAKHWPNVPRIGDVRDFKGHEFGEFDLLAAGYPCQPFSIAGRRLGERDERHLWPEVLRLIQGVRPRIVLLENVRGHLSLGFAQVLSDLASCGYYAGWDCLPAAAVGAPHQRDRLFVVAYPDGGRQPRLESSEHPAVGGVETLGVPVSGCNTRKLRGAGDVPNARGSGLEGGEAPRYLGSGWAQAEQQLARYVASSGRAQWAAEPNVDRVANGIPAGVDRLRALGNAVVPQVVEFMGRLINDAVARGHL